MSRPAVRPTGVERTFGQDEVIVTKTDRAGRMTYVNDVFCRVSVYPETEMLGQPHNMIRHPDMPRAVFKLLWDTVGAGSEIFAFVVNLAADGAHYWVLAHVTPTLDARGAVVGYHSNRRVPGREAVAAVEELYRELCAVEARAGSANEAAAAGYDALLARLDQAGQTYDEFVWSLIGEAA
ncbi:PAS domain-containing protein [Nocardioides sp. YIM 152588]|uniref:PAS domain-containing protein n=1 Tax=Nocardioides sp. YIM 152588 TaxID=3158259 RepID=UPI0032E460AA